MENETEKTLTFGETFGLEKFIDGEWKLLDFGEAVFPTIGYLLAPHTQREHTYHIRDYTDRLGKGTYRITTAYSENFESGKHDSYSLYGEFIVN